MSNVRPRKALALPLRCTPPASIHSARLHLSSLLGPVKVPRAESAPVELAAAVCARAFRSALLELGAHERASVPTEASSHLHRSPHPPPHRSSLLARQVGACVRGCHRRGRIFTARQAVPLKCRMAFTSATLAWPNPSFEATSQRPLRALCAAPQLKRWAPCSLPI